MGDVLEFAGANAAPFLLGLLALNLIVILCVIVLFRKSAQLSRRRNAKLAEGRVEDIVECINDQFEVLTGLKDQISRLEARSAEQSAALGQCLKNVGVVRFDAFEDVGGEQSFAVAMLDASRRGVVISTSMAGRTRASTRKRSPTVRRTGLYRTRSAGLWRRRWVVR